MESHVGYIMTVSNSIIGVSILAMPYCFKQCGVLLAILMLLASSFISRLTCHYLLKSATMARRRTFELLAFHTFGSMGKLIVELGIIGFLMGTCVAFFVIIGDLGPAIIAKILELEQTDTLRTTLLVCVAAFCVLPLGLLRNVESLSSVSTATIGFYFCLVLKTISESATHIATGDWMSKVELWRPAGVLQCLPIFAMALSCQTQLFEIYDTLPNASLEKMNYVVRMAVNICVAVYVCVGVFGYVAFAARPFTGNILMSFSPSTGTDIMKIGFVLSVACSFPLVIFPCRASLNSLLFKKYIPSNVVHACLLTQTQTELNDINEGYNPYEGMSNFIPEPKFKMLTFFIVGVSLTIGILIPNIEVVLGLLGSTIGTLICVIFPVTCFICISTKNTNERILAQIMLFVGVIMMVMGTYANLYAMEEIKTSPVVIQEPIRIDPENILKSFKKEVMEIAKVDEIKKDEIIVPKLPDDYKNEEKLEIRQEPPQPEEPVYNGQKDEVKEKIRIEPPQPEEPIGKKQEEVKIEEVRQEPPELEEPIDQKKELKIKEVRQEPPQPEAPIEAPKDEEKKKVLENVDKPVVLEKQKIKPEKIEPGLKAIISSTLKEAEVDKAAIEKEDKEILEEGKNKNSEQKNEEILETLKKTKQEQQKMFLEQQKLLEEIKKQKKELQDRELEGIKKENELKIKAASQIVEIAKKAIETLGSQKLNDIEKVEKKIVDIKQNNSIANMLPFPLVMKNLTDDKKDVKEKPIEKIEKPVVIEVPKAVNKTVNVKNVDRKEASENVDKVGRDLLADSRYHDIGRKKREATENEECDKKENELPVEDVLKDLKNTIVNNLNFADGIIESSMRRRRK